MKVAVVIPCYRVRNHIEEVLSGIGSVADAIYVVDDQCPERTGAFIEHGSQDGRISVIVHEVNRGVGGL